MKAKRMKINEIIKKRRKQLGLTAEDIAKKLGVSRATVYRYESEDIEKIPVSALIPLSKALKCSPNDLIGWEELDDDSETELNCVEDSIYVKIKYLREKNGLSQNKLAKLAGYSDRSSIAKIENGSVDLPLSKIEIIADVLNTTVQYLLGFEKEYSNSQVPSGYQKLTNENKLRVQGYIDALLKLQNNN